MKESYEDTENDFDNLIEIINKTDLTKTQVEEVLRNHWLYEYMDFKTDTVELDRVLLMFEDDRLKNIEKQW